MLLYLPYLCCTDLLTVIERQWSIKWGRPNALYNKPLDITAQVSEDVTLPLQVASLIGQVDKLFIELIKCTLLIG